MQSNTENFTKNPFSSTVPTESAQQRIFKWIPGSNGATIWNPCNANFCLVTEPRVKLTCPTNRKFVSKTHPGPPKLTAPEKHGLNKKKISSKKTFPTGRHRRAIWPLFMFQRRPLQMILLFVRQFFPFRLLQVKKYSQTPSEIGKDTVFNEPSKKLRLPR